jgi:hypothetical protein
MGYFDSDLFRNLSFEFTIYLYKMNVVVCALCWRIIQNCLLSTVMRALTSAWGRKVYLEIFWKLVNLLKSVVLIMYNRKSNCTMIAIITIVTSILVSHAQQANSREPFNFINNRFVSSN